MNKVYVATAIALTAVTMASAQQDGGAMRRPTMASSTAMMRAQVEAMMPVVITTGDAATDAQLKLVVSEMEAKIKAIHDEYQVKIRAIIGDKKPMPIMATTTASSSMRGGPRDDLPMMRNENATGTEMMRGEGEVRGDAGLHLGQGMQADLSARIKNFFRGFFGGN